MTYRDIIERIQSLNEQGKLVLIRRLMSHATIEEIRKDFEVAETYNDEG